VKLTAWPSLGAEADEDADELADADASVEDENWPEIASELDAGVRVLQLVGVLVEFLAK
jgi:hypothetical protein